MKMFSVISLFLLASLLFGCISSSPEEREVAKQTLARYSYEDAKNQFVQDTSLPLGGMNGLVVNSTGFVSDLEIAEINVTLKGAAATWTLQVTGNETKEDSILTFSRSNEFVIMLKTEPLSALKFDVEFEGWVCTPLSSHYAAIYWFNNYVAKCRGVIDITQRKKLLVRLLDAPTQNTTIFGLLVPFEKVANDDLAKHNFETSFEFEKENGELQSPSKAFRFTLEVQNNAEVG